MQNYFGSFYFGELEPYNSKYCSNSVLQLIFAPFKFTVLFGSRNKGHANIRGFTLCNIDTFDRLDVDCVVKGKDVRECNMCAKFLDDNFCLLLQLFI